jgi:hypothetical protein
VRGEDRLLQKRKLEWSGNHTGSHSVTRPRVRHFASTASVSPQDPARSHSAPLHRQRLTGGECKVSSVLIRAGQWKALGGDNFHHCTNKNLESFKTSSVGGKLCCLLTAGEGENCYHLLESNCQCIGYKLHLSANNRDAVTLGWTSWDWIAHITKSELGMVAHTCNPSTWVAKAGGLNPISKKN